MKQRWLLFDIYRLPLTIAMSSLLFIIFWLLEIPGTLKWMCLVCLQDNKTYKQNWSDQLFHTQKASIWKNGITVLTWYNIKKQSAVNSMCWVKSLSLIGRKYYFYLLVKQTQSLLEMF